MHLQEKLDMDLMGRTTDGYYNNRPGTVQDYARELIKATALREVELYFPKVFITWWPVIKYHIWPDWMRKIVRNYRLSKQKK